MVPLPRFTLSHYKFNPHYFYIIANVSPQRKQLAPQYCPKNVLDFVYHWEVFWEPQGPVNFFENYWSRQNWKKLNQIVFSGCFMEVALAVKRNQPIELSLSEFNHFNDYYFHQLLLKPNRGKNNYHHNYHQQLGQGQNIMISQLSDSCLKVTSILKINQCCKIMLWNSWWCFQSIYFEP